MLDGATYDVRRIAPADTKPRAAKPRERETFGMSIGDLEAKSFPAPVWIVDGVIPEGATILAGMPKMGKSLLVLDIALAVASGSTVLGNRQCAHGDVLYLALEDNLRRLQSRCRKMIPDGEPWPARLTVATEWPRANADGIAKIKRWAASVEKPALVIVDVLTAFRAHPGPNEKKSTYSTDYDAIAGLRDMANEIGCGVVVVHHVRKGQGDDVMEDVSGTLGLAGAADTIVVLKNTPEAGAVLRGRGRDLEDELDLAVVLDRDAAKWRERGAAADVSKSDERKQVLAVLRDADEPLSVKDITDATGMSRNNVDQLLWNMRKAGEVIRPKRGAYVHADRVDLLHGSDDVSPHKIDKKIRNWHDDDEDGGDE